MKTPALRVVCAALWLSFCITPPLLVLELAPLGSGLMDAFVLSLAFLMGLAGAASARRVVPALRWRELLLALPFTPIIPALFLVLVETVYPFKAQGPVGTVGEMVLVLTPWADSGVFLLPLLDNDLRQKEPAVAVRRTRLILRASFLAVLILFGLMLRSGITDFVFVVLPFVIAVGWFLGVTKRERAGAYWAALGTLVWFAAVMGWKAINGYFFG